MNSFFGFVVGLLQTTLSLLGFVQQHPELPVDQQQQVEQVAEQAVDQATQLISQSPSTLLQFTSPKTGEIVSVKKQATISWTIAPGTQGKFKDFWIMFEIISSDGQRVGSIGDGYRWSENKATWNI